MKDMSLKARLCETPWTRYDKKKNYVTTIGYDLLTDYSNATTHGKVLVYDVQVRSKKDHQRSTCTKRETDFVNTRILD